MLDDDGKLRQRYVNKRVNAAKEGIDFLLTFEQFCDLLREAGIKSSDCGIKKYHLSRFEDQGNYEVGNCRFIFYLKNYFEKKISDKSREAGRQNITIYNLSKTNEDKRCHL